MGKVVFFSILLVCVILIGLVHADPEILAYLKSEREKIPALKVSEIEEGGQRIRTIVKDKNYYMDLFFEHLTQAHTTAQIMGFERHLDSAEKAHNLFYMELEEASRYIVTLCKQNQSLSGETDSSTLCNSVKSDAQKIKNEILKKFSKNRTVQELAVKYDLKTCYYAIKDEKGKEIERRLELSFENVDIGPEYTTKNEKIHPYNDFFGDSAPKSVASPLTLHISIHGSQSIDHLASESPGFSNDPKTKTRKFESEAYFAADLTKLPLKVKVQREIRSLQLQLPDQNSKSISAPIILDEFDLNPILRKSEYCQEASNPRDKILRETIIKFPQSLNLWAY